MAITSCGSQTSHTAADAQDWLAVTQRQCAALVARAAEAGDPRQLYTAFREMTALLQEACEEVRVMSASLREESQAVRDQSRALRGYSTQLFAHCPTALEPGAPWGPPVAEVRQTESRLLAVFKGDTLLHE